MTTPTKPAPTAMTSRQRVMAALNHQPPDRIPTFDGFWEEFRAECIRELQLPAAVDLDDYFGIDIGIMVADESPFPTHVEMLSQHGDETVARDGWGRVVRTRRGGFFYEELDYLIHEPQDLDRIQFDAPDLTSRYRTFDAARFRADRRCLFCKVGGPYIRSSFIRGKENFLADIAGDPGFAKALADKVADHLIHIGLESLRRGGLYDTGIWIYDDMAYNLQPMMSPRSFECLFLPAYRRMVKAYKDAGAAKVVLHSDGNIEPLLDMLLDAGIDGINPIEPKAGMHLPTLKQRYGDRLAFIGGMCNAHVLPKGPAAAIEHQAREIIDVARHGGVVIGAHSIGPDVPVAHYLHYHRFVADHGTFA